MFKLEKVFQNDDSVFIIFSKLLKILIIFLSLYISIILEKNTIYDLYDYKIYLNASYFKYSIIYIICYLFFSIFLEHKSSYYKKNFHFFNEDISNIFISFIITNLIIFLLILVTQ